jgi:hypothetical protein
MSTYVQLGPQMGSRFQIARLRRRPRERRPMLALGLITVVLVSGLWFGARIGPPEAAGSRFDPVQYVGR